MLRHCAFCLKGISGGEIKLCGNCHRRSYCSRECQISDWGEKGQNHKIWCKDSIGEEDIDWEVKESIGKGLGLFAKKLIPKHSKIFVEKGYKSYLQAPQDLLNTLMPSDGKPKEKFAFNSFYSDDGDCDVLGIRLSRANHDCINNATSKFIVDLNCFVLVSKKDIQTGEEISIQYNYFNDFSNSKQKRDLRNFVLISKWGITCSDSCPCQDKTTLLNIQKANELDSLIPMQQYRSERDVRKSLQRIDELIKMGEELGVGEILLSRTYYDGFQVSIMNKKTFPLHKNYIQKYKYATEIIDSNHSEKYQTVNKLFTNPSSHRNYLLVA